MMNTPITGRIYHVVDKTTGEVVKVGSTITSLVRRFRSGGYEKYTNHFLCEAKSISSSEADWYEPKNPFCPFLWHLAASEHLEILKMGTFRKNSLSNKQSPLDQKYFGFDSRDERSSLGGLTQGKRNVESGHLAEIRSRRTKEEMIATGKRLGRWSVDSGHIHAIKTPESLSKGGKIGGVISGRMNAENGHLDRIGKLPQSRLARFKNGKRLGRQNVESGFIKSLSALSAEWTKNNPQEAKKNASMGGSKCRDLKIGVHKLSDDECINNGRKGGMVAVASGQIQELGRKNAESGRLKECSHIR
jgi:hypothetical protein